MDLLNPSIEQLVAEIVALNHAWKEACELFDERENSPLSQSLRDLKTCKQIRLLHSYAPLGKVYLALDDQLSDEPLYSLLLQESIDNRWNVEHLPVRVAEEYLSSAELERFTRNN